ncbi:dihydroneopterin aldolase [Corynebacterium bovis]|uniref:7,8-dihydroneopterin aldolase n=2 Tax=Corynebacterium bovis TaxID=36808 RepID=A0A3R8RIL3_9CORY|nr:dihydroneopterin aldolase [Corynebacterium bovis]MBB3115457.1 dihydroneopterin aldolase [Corynebacterium bovis DSM 20582 = CIP 54.80]MDH2456502.1 dihydroneopterin aldolase [Corynebacterium bovis]MDK8510038.1 dihydroneopterin aldolase [Corynebacterium bovis]MDN8579353.1 dihydroneopterin aldolase [Corynebacterium bovis]QQC48325.1 dihydroneopterin aldolase [Corynebacterium bovis]
MADRIELTGLEAWGYHGVYSDEKEHGQRFLVDLVVWTDFTAAVRSDRIADTLSYVDLAREAVEVVEGPGYDLIESLAAAVADRINAREGVYAVEVTVHKPDAPIPYPFSDVRVVARRSRKAPDVRT